MRGWPFRTLIIIGIAAIVATAMPTLREFFAVDSCLDGGGVYDYAAQICRTDVQSLPVPARPILRKPDSGSIVLALGVALALARLFVTLDRRARARAAA